jgi:acetolactate synthase-1/2/3 large subunit
MKVSDYIVKELLNLGVSHVFMLPGGFSIHLNDSIAHSDLRPIYCLDERAAVFAACAYSQYTGNISVCSVTSGPGSTNALTGIASAYIDSLPVLVICGEVRIPHVEMREKWSLREGGPQDVDMLKIARPLVKYIEMIKNPNGTKFIFEQAVKYAMSDRKGPSVIVIPLDVQGMEINENSKELSSV